MSHIIKISYFPGYFFLSEKKVFLIHRSTCLKVSSDNDIYFNEGVIKQNNLALQLIDLQLRNQKLN